MAEPPVPPDSASEPSPERIIAFQGVPGAYSHKHIVIAGIHRISRVGTDNHIVVPVG